MRVLLERRDAIAFLVFVALACDFLGVIEASENSLYKPEDDLLELNVNTFDTAIYNQSTAFVVEFYSSWCGHCIDYAPRYVQFAKLLKPWRGVVVTAALNCADELNAPICRQHEIDAFPTLKYFKVWSKTKEDSVKFTGDRTDLTAFSLFVAAQIKADFDVFRPVTWPNYEFTPDSQTSMAEIWTANGVGAQPAALLVVVVEPDDTMYNNAIALMTNYADERRVLVVRLRPSHPLAARFGGTHDPPELYIFKIENTEQPAFLSNHAMQWTDIKTRLDRFLDLEAPLIQQQIQLPISPNTAEQSASILDWTQYEVQLLDLQKALLYMLTIEVPRNPKIRGAELAALRSWIHVLRKYAPGTASMRRLFYRLDEWLAKRSASDSVPMRNEISADEWLAIVEKIQDELGRPLPIHSEYLACQGSESKFRGYTCGLWTLFHAITVQAYKDEKTNVHFKPYTDVLEPLHQFVVQFLSCETCARHFDKMTRERHMSDVHRLEDVVLWLWSAHNSVNRRLSGDATDDPKFPKREFPPASLCEKCRITSKDNPFDVTFDEAATLEFLVQYYSTIKTDEILLQLDYEMKRFENGKLDSVVNRRLNPKFSGMAGKVDKMEEVEARLQAIRQEHGPKREWRNIGNEGNVFVNGPAITDRSTFYVLWLVILVLLAGVAYAKYRQKRSKLWKMFYYYNDYKLMPWRRDSNETSHSKFVA